ncbi:MAG TPA: iron-containing redox enzyme family protein [Candidatus Brachybacterium intestinipullorum]|uniref:Iron-containing redox enzyme family protein n=1 Tax=Candidatus Brachybacterium intestinipullorum TaxID=2838512 RepID=A0A9D2PYZ1_9MICO|nr:iron-containing redox enzyme family protein [Candidatus Brachybacterium intestinipullorum]
MHRGATAEQARQFLRHKSIYTLKESDHTTWTIPRLSYPVKAAVMELQYDEYGAGNPHRLHAHLFAKGLAASGLDSEYGAYLDEAPLEVLMQNNVMSLFGLNRRLRAASLGFHAAFEATSSAPRARSLAVCSGSTSRRRWSSTTPSTSRPTRSMSSSRCGPCAAR